MTRRIVICELTERFIPLPEERRPQYMAAIRYLAQRLFACEPPESVPAQAGSSAELTPTPQPEAQPEAGLTNQPELIGNCPFPFPSIKASQLEASWLAKEITGGSKEHSAG